MEDNELKELLDRFKAGKCSPEDIAFLESWYLTHNRSSQFEMTEDERVDDLDEVWERIEPKKVLSRKINMFSVIPAAAALLVFISIGGYFLLRKKATTSENITVRYDGSPGKNEATLTLNKGKKLLLSSAATGQLASEDGVIISRNKDGELVYSVPARLDQESGSTGFNKLETAKGEQFQVLLPDGSHVWLNATSSLKYPVVFTGKERLVELVGEAYFEVAHNKAMPFKVKTSQQVVEVLGTHFNVCAYNDEKVTATTLIQGSVKVSPLGNKKDVIIKPGQQATVNAELVNVKQVDTDEAIAWKNGYFQFNNESLENVMRKISRWYNVDVEYKDNSPRSMVFSGTISKYKNVSQVINVLQLTNSVHFKIDANKIIITK